MRKMKDSGVEWIGEIPEEWETVPLKSQFNFGKGLPITKENLIEKGIPVISYGQIHSKSNDGVHITDDLIRFVDEQYIQSNPLSLVKKFSFIFADTSEDLEGCGNCVYFDSDYQLFAGYHTIILQSQNNKSNKYLAYLFKSDAWRKQIREQVSGVKLFSISQKILKSVSVIIPPISEQQKIAAYLDEKCTEIDSVISKTKATIEEYKKLKQSIITQAVTKGIRKGRKMKDSGIEWIGEIPEEYHCQKLKTFADIISKGTTPKEMSTEIDEKYSVRYIKSENIVNNILLDSPLFSITESVHIGELQRSQLSNRDILFVIAGASIGKVAIMKESFLPANTNQATSFIRIKEKYFYCKKYLWYFLQSNLIGIYISLYAVQSAQPNLSMEDLGNINIPFTDNTNEIEQVIEYLDSRCNEIDNLIAKKEQLLTELENYKKSVIYEYVTGKKEVR